MRKRFFFPIVFIISISSYGQKYYAADILKKADSIMIATVGERVFREYFQYDSLSYFQYKNYFGKTKWETLTHVRKTRGKFKNMSVRYSFYLKKYNYYSGTHVLFDSLLNQKESILTYFIPEYVINNTECNFISDTTAIAIAKSKFTKKGIEPNTVRFEYNHKKYRYSWVVDNKFTKRVNEIGSAFGEVQIIEIDAITGEVINFYPDAMYGIIIR